MGDQTTPSTYDISKIFNFDISIWCLPQSGKKQNQSSAVTAVSLSVGFPMWSAGWRFADTSCKFQEGMKRFLIFNTILQLLLCWCWGILHKPSSGGCRSHRSNTFSLSQHAIPQESCNQEARISMWPGLRRWIRLHKNQQPNALFIITNLNA